MSMIERAARAFLGLALMVWLAGALAQPGGPEEVADWPCEQALVPEVSAAVVWAGPPVDGLEWRQDEEVASLVRRMTASGVAVESAERAMSSFADAQDEGTRDARLTLVFAGVLETLNRDRAHLIDGIKRYSRDQTRRAEAIGRELDALVTLEQETSAEALAEASELRERMAIEERVFDQRERAFQFLCRRPIAVEERLGVLARSIARHLGG